MEIIRRGERVTAHRFSFDYQWPNEPTGSGYSFPCDENGTILTTEMQQPGLENLAKCQNGTYDIICVGLVKSEWTYWQHAIGRCQCKRTVDLIDFTNACACGRYYNSSGQELCHPSLWEETWDEEPGVFTEDDLEYCYNAAYGF